MRLTWAKISWKVINSADLVSMARPFLAVSHILQKSREGTVKDINTCIACNQACLGHAFVGKVRPFNSSY